jgi:MFS family permease
VPRRFSFARLVVGVLLLNAASGVLFAVLPIFEVQEGGGPLLATLIVGAPLSAQILATFLWGALSDRLGRRRELLVGGIVGQSVLFLAYPFLGPIGLLLVRIVQVFLGATSTLATTVATEDPSRTAGQGLGSLSFWGGVGGLLGVIAGYPLLGGSEFRSTSPTALGLFVLLAALSAASVVCLALSGELGRRRSPVSLAGLFRFRGGPWVLRLSLAAAIVGLANYTVYTLFPLFVRDILSPQAASLYGSALNPTQQLALLSFGAGLGGVLVSPITGRWVEGRRLRRQLYLLAPVLYAGLWVGFALVRSYAAIFLIWSIPAAIFFQIPLTREVAALTPLEERGRAVGLFLAAYYLGGLVGSVLAGLGAGAGWTFASMFLLAAAVDLLGSLTLVVILYGGRGLPEPSREGLPVPAL